MKPEEVQKIIDEGGEIFEDIYREFASLRLKMLLLRLYSLIVTVLLIWRLIWC